jgi:hypothetical protein
MTVIETARTYSERMGEAARLAQEAKRAYRDVATAIAKSHAAIEAYYEVAKTHPDEPGRAFAHIFRILSMAEKRGTPYANVQNHARVLLGLLCVSGAGTRQDLDRAPELFDKVAENLGRPMLVAVGLINDHGPEKLIGGIARKFDRMKIAHWELTHRAARRRDPDLANPHRVRMLEKIGFALREVVKNEGTVMLADRPRTSAGVSSALAGLFPRAQQG